MRFLKLSLLALPLTTILLVSCNNSTKKSEDKKELKEEVQDVHEEVNEIVNMEKKELKDNVNAAIADFNSKMEKLDAKIKSGNQELNQETNELLNNLKAQRDQLKVKLDTAEMLTEDKWEDFKNEFEHDINNFNKSVQDFFKDNE